MNRIRLAMVDLWSVCDDQGKPIGHGKKVGNEYREYLNEECEVNQYVNESMQDYIISGSSKSVKFSLTNKDGKLVRCIKQFINVVDISRHEKNIWFYIPDFYCIFLIMLLRKKNRKFIVNIFEEYADNKIKHWVLQRVIHKADVLFITNKNLLNIAPEGILIPDYAYNKDLYGSFKRFEKKDRVVCLGTMNNRKMLEEAVRVFSAIGYPLYIMGQFTDEERYRCLCSIKSANVVIENRFIEDKEYYEMMASSKYCLIPYDPEFYKNRTSGVIQECIFMNTIPITHKDILNFVGLNGIGYCYIEDLKKLNLSEYDTENIIKANDMEIREFYDYDNVKRRIVEAIFD